jgi:hypothetical protein
VFQHITQEELITAIGQMCKDFESIQIDICEQHSFDMISTSVYENAFGTAVHLGNRLAMFPSTNCIHICYTICTNINPSKGRKIIA